MDETDVHVTEERPSVGKKVEVIISREVKDVNGTASTVETPWVCTVLNSVTVTSGNHLGETAHVVKGPSGEGSSDVVGIQLDIEPFSKITVSKDEVEELNKWPNEIKVKFDGLGRATRPAWVHTSRVNQTG